MIIFSFNVSELKEINLAEIYTTQGGQLEIKSYTNHS